MKKRFRRVVAAFSLIALASVIAAAPATAADPSGVSSAGGGLSLLSVDYGELLDAVLVGEHNSDTIDPSISVPTATQVLAPLTTHTELVGDLSSPVIATSSTGDPDEQSGKIVNLGGIVPGVEGEINPATLKSLVDADGAKSTLTSTLANLNALGIVTVDATELNIGGFAGSTQSAALRGITADAITVLDLQAVLNLLGLNLDDLSVDTLINLIGSLNLLDAVNGAVPGLSAASIADIDLYRDGLVSAIPEALGDLSALLALIGDTCDNALDSIALLAAGLANCAALDAAISAIDDLETLINGLTGVLEGAPLLAIRGVTVGTFANAKDTVANSSAAVVGTIDHIMVGNTDLGGVNAVSTLENIDALLTSVQTTLSSTLSLIDLDLADLLSLKILERTTDVSQAGDYVTAAAGITALALTIDLPNICDVASRIVGTNFEFLPDNVVPAVPASPLSDLLDELGSGVSCIQVERQAGLQAQAIGEGEIAALTAPMTFRVASVGSNANFKVAAASTPETPTTPNLPRTGIDEMLLLIVGGLMAAAALGVRRVTAVAKVTDRRQ